MPTVPKNRHGFTLFELLIVVLLIAILYGVFINKLQQNAPKEQREQVTLTTLKKLLSQFPVQHEREVICTEPCKECRIYLDGHPLEEGELTLFETPPTVWRPDPYGAYQPVTFSPLLDPRHEAKQVCFRFSLFRNGSSSSYIVQTGEKRYLVFRPYLFPVTEYASLDDARESVDSEALLPTEQRQYDF